MLTPNRSRRYIAKPLRLPEDGETPLTTGELLVGLRSGVVSFPCTDYAVKRNVPRSTSPRDKTPKGN